MFNEQVQVGIIPFLWRTSQVKAFYIFLFLDLIPNLFNCYYFVLLTIVELYLIVGVGFNFSDDKYFFFANIRMGFYAISIFLILFLFLYKKDDTKDGTKVNAVISDGVNIILLVLEIIFIVW